MTKKGTKYQTVQWTKENR